MTATRYSACPDCGAPKMRSAARCDPCYRKFRVGNNNRLMGAPLVLSAAAVPTGVPISAPFDIWRQPPIVAARPGPKMLRWRMTAWGEWEEAV